MNRLIPVLCAALLLTLFLTGCAIENRVVANKAWDAAPATVAIESKVNTSEPMAGDFTGMVDTRMKQYLEGYEYQVTSDAPMKIVYTVDILEPGNRWLRWLAGLFGAGQGYAQGKVMVMKDGMVVGEYEYGVVQRGGFLFGGTLNDLANQAAWGIATKVHKQKFDTEMYQRN